MGLLLEYLSEHLLELLLEVEVEVKREAEALMKDGVGLPGV